MSDNVVVMEDNNYKNLIASNEYVVVDVWAVWCGPCKRTTPVFEDMADQNPNKRVLFAKLDADNNIGASAEFRITSLPSFLIFQNGQLVKKWAGGDVSRLRKEITAVVNS